MNRLKNKVISIVISIILQITFLLIAIVLGHFVATTFGLTDRRSPLLLGILALGSVVTLLYWYYDVDGDRAAKRSAPALARAMCALAEAAWVKQQNGVLPHEMFRDHPDLCAYIPPPSDHVTHQFKFSNADHRFTLHISGRRPIPGDFVTVTLDDHKGEFFLFHSNGRTTVATPEAVTVPVSVLRETLVKSCNSKLKIFSVDGGIPGAAPTPGNRVLDENDDRVVAMVKRLDAPVKRRGFVVFAIGLVLSLLGLATAYADSPYYLQQYFFEGPIKLIDQLRDKPISGVFGKMLLAWTGLLTAFVGGLYAFTYDQTIGRLKRWITTGK